MVEQPTVGHRDDALPAFCDTRVVRDQDHGAVSFDRPAQETQIMISRNLDAAKLLQMRCKPLRIEQPKLSHAQPLDQRDKHNL